MWENNYNNWKNQDLPIDLKNELNSLSKEEIKEVFYKDLEFGTGGLRGIMGVGTNRINEIIIKKITLGFTNYLNNNNLTNGVAISYDNRNNSKEFAYLAASVLAANNIKSFIYPNLRPTPMLSFAVKHFNASGGIMITASHNPKEYNGYKVYNSDGAQLNLKESNDVINEISKIDDIFNIPTVNNNLINEINIDEIDKLYLSKVREITINTFEDKAKVLYSPLHGTGGTITRKLMSNSSNFMFYEPHMVNDGNFSNTKSSNPEELIAYEDIIKYAKTIDADLIALTDPDADRLGVAVKHNNEYQILSGNETAIITLYYLISEKIKNNIDIKDGYVYTTNVTSDLIDIIARKNNLNVVETLSGFKFIAEQILNQPTKSPYIFGCEESNGNIISDFVRDKDAIQAVFMFCEIADYLKNNKLSAIDYLDIIYQEYGYIINKNSNFTFKGLTGSKMINNLMNHFRTNGLIISGLSLISVEDNFKQTVTNSITNEVIASHLPKSNVLKFTYSDSSWIVLRPSGTEPKLKVYFSSFGKNENESLAKLESNMKLVNSIIEGFSSK